MSVPASLLADVASGAAYVQGALVKDAASNVILAHLQPTRLLSEALSLGVSGPLGAMQTVTGLGQSLQLLEIQKTLDLVQTISSVGAVTSVLNLGVSIGGFAMVLAALKRVQRTLSSVEAAVHRVENKLDLAFFARIDTWLRRAEETFALPIGERTARWLATEERLDEQMDELLGRIKLLGIALDGDNPMAVEAWSAADQGDVTTHLRLLLALADARAEALLCLNSPQLAAAQFERQAGWLSQLPSDAKAVTLARINGRSLSTDQLSRVVKQSKAMTTWIQAARGVASQRADISRAMHGLGVDSLEYVTRVRCDPEPTLLVLAYR